MEPVPECQSPLFLHVDATDRAHVRLFFSAPAEAPTTRGFAAILAAGLDDHSADEILAVPDDFYSELGLAGVDQPAAATRHVGDAGADQAAFCVQPDGPGSSSYPSATSTGSPGPMSRRLNCAGYILKDVS